MSVPKSAVRRKDRSPAFSSFFSVSFEVSDSFSCPPCSGRPRSSREEIARGGGREKGAEEKRRAISFASYKESRKMKKRLTTG